MASKIFNFNEHFDIIVMLLVLNMHQIKKKIAKPNIIFLVHFKEVFFLSEFFLGGFFCNILIYYTIFLYGIHLALRLVCFLKNILCAVKQNTFLDFIIL